MQTQADWLRRYKDALNIRSDYKLAEHWQTTRAEISHLNTGRRKLSLSKKLHIAQVLELDPIQILVSCDWKKARESEKESLGNEYMKSLVRTYKTDVPSSFYKKRKFGG